MYPSALPQVARRCYDRPWAVNMRTDLQHQSSEFRVKHQAGGKRAPSHHQAPIHVHAHAHAQGQGQGRKQAWGKALAPALGANGSVPPPYQKFHPDERWKTVYSSSYTPHPSSTYQEMIDGGVKHSDSAMRHAESVRLARMNVALTKLKPAEVAKSMAEQCARATPSPLSHSPAHPPFTRDNKTRCCPALCARPVTCCRVDAGQYVLL